jgi:hypothetical protein
MRISRLVMNAAVLLLLIPCVVRAQQKPTGDTPPTESVTPVKVQVVLSEYEGAKKINNLLYVVPVNALDGKFSPTSSIRDGVRVPVVTSISKTGENPLTYIDVGTNLDIRVKHSEDGRFMVDLTVDRSSLYANTGTKDGNTEWIPGEPPPTIRQFRGVVSILVRDGQAGEQTAATDPLTGQVLKVDVLLTVSK